MNIERYNKISAFCFKGLIKIYHDRHLEDLIQFVAMRDFETKEKGNWSWFLADYCRANGLNKNEKSKKTARTLEVSLSIDAPGAHEDSENSNYLLDQESISRSYIEDEMIHSHDSIKGALEEFLSPLNLKMEVLKWVLKSFKVKTN